MNVLVTAPSRKNHPENNMLYDFILQQDNWNDFSFITKYHLYITGKLTGLDEITYAGVVKIIKKGQSEADYYMVEEGEFSYLSDEFCSVGQSLDYYGRLSELGREICDKILLSLRDINMFDYVSEGFKNERSWERSIMRDLNDDDDIFILPKFIIKNQFSAIPSIDMKFSFVYSGMINTLSFDFDSIQYGFFKSEKLPCRMSVIVGRNGCGKSTTLARLSRVAYSSTQDRKNEQIAKIGEILPEGLGFPKIINLSYSAFDSFQIPGCTFKEKKQLRQDILDGKGRYIYCGIRDVVAELDYVLANVDENNMDIDFVALDRQEKTILKPLEILSDEFHSALIKIHKDGSKWNLFNKVMMKLREEPSLYEVIDEIFREDFIPKSKTYFHGLSTGHKFVLHSMVNILLYIEKRCLVLFDEPETHLHPPLLAVLMSALRTVLNEVDAFAIVATHSPVVVQETLSKNVNVITRNGEFTDFQRPEIETFGENIGVITSSVFSLTTQITDYHDELDKLINECKNHNNPLDDIERCFDKGLSTQARSYVISKLAVKG